MSSKLTLEDIAKSLALFQMKYPKLILWFFLGLTLVFIPGIFNLIYNVEPSLEKVLPQNIDEIKTMNNMRTQFGADMLYLVVYAEHPINDIRNPQYVTYINTLSSKLEERELIVNVQGLDDILLSSNNLVLPQSQQQIKDLVNLNPLSTQYISKDYSFSVLKLQTSTGSSAELINQIIDEIDEDINSLEELNPGTRIEKTGSTAIDRATFNVILMDFAFITFISMAFIGVIVYFSFKSLTKGFLPMIIVMNALVMTMGIVGYLQLTLTVVSMVAAAMIMGLGIDFGIHQVYSYFELRKTKSSEETLIEVLSELLRAMIGASLTTMAGFLALLFGVLPAMKTLGIILAIGIFTTLIGAIFLLPVIIYLYDVSQSKKKMQTTIK